MHVLNIILTILSAGLLLFYLSEGIRFSIKNGNSSGPMLTQLQGQLAKLREESLKIMSLDPEDDDHRKLVFKYLHNTPWIIHAIWSCTYEITI